MLSPASIIMRPSSPAPLPPSVISLGTNFQYIFTLQGCGVSSSQLDPLHDLAQRPILVDVASSSYSVGNLGKRQPQCFGDPCNAEETRIADAALNAADIGRVQAGFLSQHFLSKVTGFALSPDVEPKRSEDGMSPWHDS